MKKTKEPLILVSERQRDNPVTKELRLPHAFAGGLAEDFLLSRSVSVLYLSLKYHSLYPLYIRERLSALASSPNHTRILICLLDAVLIFAKQK